MKLSKMEQRLLNVIGGEYVSSATLMDRLYVGLRRPKSNTIPSMISRLRKKGINIETLRGKGYRLGYPWFTELPGVGVGKAVHVASNKMVDEVATRLPISLCQGNSISNEIRGMMARYGLNFSVVAELAMKAIRAIATPAPAYLLTAPPKYGAIDYVKNAEGVYEAE